MNKSTKDDLLNLPFRCSITAASFSLTEVMACSIIFGLSASAVHVQGLAPQWLAEGSVQTPWPCSTVPHKIIWPAPIRWQRLSSMIWWWSSPRSSWLDQTRGAKPRSPSISQLHRTLSPHVKRLSAPVITHRRGTAGNRDRMRHTAEPEPEEEEKTLFLLHQAQHDRLCSEPMPDPQRAEILPWPHHTLGLTKHFMAWSVIEPRYALPSPSAICQIFLLYRGQFFVKCQISIFILDRHRWCKAVGLYEPPANMANQLINLHCNWAKTLSRNIVGVHLHQRAVCEGFLWSADFFYYFNYICLFHQMYLIYLIWVDVEKPADHNLALLAISPPFLLFWC